MMRRVYVRGELFIIPTGWTWWESRDLFFQQREDGSIWSATRTYPNEWRCVSPCVLPVRRSA